MIFRWLSATMSTTMSATMSTFMSTTMSTPMSATTMSFRHFLRAQRRWQNGNPKKYDGPTNQPIYELTGVGARDVCALKKAFFVHSTFFSGFGHCGAPVGCVVVFSLFWLRFFFSLLPVITGETVGNKVFMFFHKIIFRTGHFSHI